MINRILVLIVLLLSIPIVLHASTITFPTSSNTFTENGHNFTVTGNGYVWNTDYRSASYCALCNTSYGNIIITKTSGNTFQLNNLWIKGAWAGFQLVVKGFNDATQLYTTGTISVSSSYAQTTLSNWTGINKITITAVSNGFFAVDDIDYTVQNIAPTNITLSNSSLTNGSVSSTIVGTFSSTDSEDPVGHTYTFASGGTDNGSFTISGTSLQTAFIANYETKSSYAIKIRSTDTGELYYEKNFTITVISPATIWSGAKTTFTKANYADWTLEANQDRITSNVWITRQNNQGIFNINTESIYAHFSSPQATEWATGTTANYSNYTYQAWEDWEYTLGATPNIVGVNAVLHLIIENIYIDIKFTSWTSGSAGGGFSYERSTDPNLPVELTSFNASAKSNNITLQWNTATELNNYGFDVLRQIHTSTPLSVTKWEKIGFVNGNGNSNSPKNYSFIDDKVSTGKYYYRLKQIDNDGQFEYSKIVEVSFMKPNEFELSQNYPNPFNPSTTIRFNLPEASIVKLTIFNILGQEIRTLVNEFKESGVNTINFDASDLNSGMYIYKIEAGNFVQTRKMTLLK